tara:strand:+ start:223 stop:1197 length:975 start_codon:yes stop_codon:yes gene_type:complete
MNGFERGLLNLSLGAILILSSLTTVLLSEKINQKDNDYSKLIDNVDLGIDGKIEFHSREEVARIASFNIKVFGDKKMSNETIVNELVEIFHNYDFVAVQEIKDIDEEVPFLFLEKLNEKYLDSSNESLQWDMVLSERSGKQEDDLNSQEQYAFYYKPVVFKLLKEGIVYDDEQNDSFQREPFLAKFMVLNQYGDETGTDIIFVNIHTKPTLAVEEMQALDDVLSWSQSNYSEDDDYVILGDLNADCSYASYSEITSLPIHSENYTWIIPDNADTTVGESRCAYDRIITSSDLDGRLTGDWGIHQEISGPSVSDHKPIWFEIKRV